MSEASDNATLIGAGAAACAVCCAGPILGLIAALGFGALAGALVFGFAGLVIAAVAGLVLVVRRRRRQSGCETPPQEHAVAMSAARGRRL